MYSKDLWNYYKKDVKTIALYFYIWKMCVEKYLKKIGNDVKSVVKGFQRFSIFFLFSSLHILVSLSIYFTLDNTVKHVHYAHKKNMSELWRRPGSSPAKLSDECGNFIRLNSQLYNAMCLNLWLSTEAILQYVRIS